MPDAVLAPPHGRRLSPNQAVGAALVAVAAFQAGIVIALSLFDEVGPVGAMLVRQVVAVVVLGAIARPRWRRLGRSDRLAVLALGLVLAGMNTCFYLALDRIPIGVALAIEISGPLAVAAIGARRRSDLAWVAVAAVGAGTLALAHGVDGPVAPAGIALALASAACWGSYLVLAGRVGRSVKGVDGLVWALAVTVLVLAPPAIASAGSDLLAPHVLVVGAIVGLVGSVLPYSLEMIALKTVAPAVLGLLVSVEPALGALSGWLLRDQVLTRPQLVGIALVVVAAAGVFRRGAA